MKDGANRLNVLANTFFANDIYTVIICFLSVVACFSHHKITPLIIYGCGIFIAVFPKTQKEIFKYKSSYFALAFLILSIFAAYFNNNTKGLSLSFLFLMITIIGVYLRRKMTKELFEWALNLVCAFCIVVFVGCVISKITHLSLPSYRTTLWFYNSNYLGSILAGCILVCAYKIATKKGKDIIYYLIALGCGICMYFTGSMFAFLEVFIGVSVLLSLTGKHRMLKWFLALCVFGMLFLYLVPEIFPRLNESNITTDNRILIWQDTIDHIPDNFLFGKGFFTYRTLTNVRYLTSHAHNLILELLLSFGIVGTLLVSICFVLYFRTLIICNRLLRKNHINALIMAIGAAVLLHATTDMTMIWSQTAIFYAFIMSGLGAEEKTVAKFRSAWHK